MVIEGKEYEVSYSLRMYYTYELITNKTFIGGTLLSMSLLFFSALLSKYNDFQYTFDEFVDILDEDKTLLEKFVKFYMAEMEKINQETDKKKVKKKK